MRPIPRPPKAVTFDCWSTLITDVSWDETMRVRVRSLIEIAKDAGTTLDEERAAELIEGSWNEHVKHWRQGRSFGASGAARSILAQMIPGARTIDEAAVNRLTSALEDATSAVGTEVVDGAPQAVAALRQAGIPTALICDTGFSPSRVIKGFLEGHGIDLDHLFFSDEVGEPKPSPVIFRRALDAVGCEPKDSVHIGDLRRTDIFGGRSFGMATIRFAGVHDDGWDTLECQGEEADHVLYRWSDLPEVLGING